MHAAIAHCGRRGQRVAHCGVNVGEEGDVVVRVLGWYVAVVHQEVKAGLRAIAHKQFLACLDGPRRCHLQVPSIRLLRRPDQSPPTAWAENDYVVPLLATHFGSVNVHNVWQIPNIADRYKVDVCQQRLKTAV